jgi:hypothetical protein
MPTASRQTDKANRNFGLVRRSANPLPTFAPAMPPAIILTRDSGPWPAPAVIAWQTRWSKTPRPHRLPTNPASAMQRGARFGYREPFHSGPDPNSEPTFSGVFPTSLSDSVTNPIP